MMITYEETSSLRPEEKDAILDAMLGMAWSDGSIHLDELDLIRRIASHFTDQDVEELVKEYKVDTERVGRKIAKSDLGPAGKRILLRVMAYVAAAEGSVDEKELAFYHGCVRAFGINEHARKRMEAEVRREVYGELLKKRLLQNELDDAAKEQLAGIRKRFEIDDAGAADVEKMVRKQIGLETGRMRAPTAPPK